MESGSILMHMKTTSCVFMFFCCLSLLSCHSRQTGEQTGKADSFDTIYVTYHKGVYETSTSTPCKHVKKWAEKKSVSEVVAISQEDFDIIFSYLSENSNKGDTSMSCEARMYVQVSEYEMCIDDWIGCACDINDNDIPTDEYALYLIRSLSGFYNYLDSLDLQFERLIEKYGMPSNYQDKTVKFANWDDESILDEVRKVALVREQ